MTLQYCCGENFKKKLKVLHLHGWEYTFTHRVWSRLDKYCSCRDNFKKKMIKCTIINSDFSESSFKILLLLLFHFLCRFVFEGPAKDAVKAFTHFNMTRVTVSLKVKQGDKIKQKHYRGSCCEKRRVKIEPSLRYCGLDPQIKWNLQIIKSRQRTSFTSSD